MEFTKMKRKIETMMPMQIVEQRFHWTPTSCDKNFTKRVTNIHSTSHNKIYEHSGLIPI